MSPFNMLEPVTSNFTMDFWVKPAAYSAAGLISQHQYGSALGFYFGMGADGSLLLVEDPHSYVRATSAAGSLQLNTWQHVALVRNNGTVYAYVNGKQVFSTTTSEAGFYGGSGSYGNVAF